MDHRRSFYDWLPDFGVLAFSGGNSFEMRIVDGEGACVDGCLPVLSVVRPLKGEGGVKGGDELEARVHLA